MKLFKKLSLLAAFALVLGISAADVNAQTEVSTGADIYSTYVWRGVAYSGPSFQPYVEVASGGFAIGAWGSQDFAGTFQEMDLYAGYSLDMGLSLGVTGYYYPGSPWMEFEDSHAFEINGGYEIESFSISANYIVNEAVNAGSIGGDMYFEAGYAIDDATSIFLGGGNGWHTNGTDDLGLVNLGISTGKDLVITDTFTIPVSGSVILNPYSENLYIVFGFSF